MALEQCRECGQQVSTEAAACPHCGVPNPVGTPEGAGIERAVRAAASTPAASESSLGPPERLLALGGAGLLFLGVFLPIISVPLFGSVNYFRNGQGDGVIILVLAAITLVLVARENYKWLWGTGLGALAMLTFTFVNFHVQIGSTRSEMQQELADNPFAEMGTAIMDTVQLEWGWIVLVMGAALIAASAWQAGRESRNAD